MKEFLFALFVVGLVVLVGLDIGTNNQIGHHLSELIQMLGGLL